jgi:uncharacterized membrane protein SpoIIM required for sporulation
MTPLQFERAHEPTWAAFERQLALGRGSGRERAALRGPEFLAAYRQCCEHLALARDRGYPVHLLERLERMTAEGHQLIYRRHSWGLAGILDIARGGFPRAVRAHWPHVLVATLLLAGPMLVMLVAVARRPELVSTVMSPGTAAEYEQMYSPTAEAVGRPRTAGTDVAMFGFYVRHNIGIAFQCFAGGVLFGIGSLFFLLENGLLIGATAGYLVARGLSGTFFPFVATHSAFELTAIVLAGAAGLRIGQALVAPGRLRRGQALAQAGRDTAPIVYGLVAMLVVAALLEAFWSSSAWMPARAKYGAAALCWIAVLSYLLRAGRPGPDRHGPDRHGN